MKKLNYKKLSIQNFLSIGNDIVVIDFQNGLNLISGNNIDNPERVNGSGKSSIIEAFYYALFGTTIRDIKKEFIINNVTKGKGYIELLFDAQTDQGTNSYKIVRTIKPSSVGLYKLGENEEDISKDSITNTNKYICDLIGSNPVICKSCDILSLSDNIPFMAKKAEEKRKFIEDIFSLEVFGRMLKDLKDIIKENKTSTSITTTKIEEITNGIDSLNRQYVSQKKQLEDREELLNKRKTDIENKISEYTNELNSIKIENGDTLSEENKMLENALKKIDSKIGVYIGKISELETLLKMKKSDLFRTNNVEGVSCDKCLQDIPHTHIEHLEIIKNNLDKDIEDLNFGLNDLKTKKNEWHSKKDKLQNKFNQNTLLINKIQKCISRKNELESSIKHYSKALFDLDHDMNSNVGSLDDFVKEIGEIENRKTEQLSIFNDLKQQSDDLDVCKFILGEEGVKSFLIKRLLEMLNCTIQTYITKLGMTMRFSFDEYFEEKITNDKGKDISYWNFSGGERKTIDIATAWAFKDIKRKITSISSNVEFLDEVLDNAFDERGMDLLIEVLKERIERDSLSCYAISHRKETMKHIDGEIVYIEKENAITRRIIDK